LDWENVRRHLQIGLGEPGYVLQQALPIARYWFNRLISDYSFGYSFALNVVFLIPNFKCNLRCKMCSLWGEEGLCLTYPQMLEEELSLDELKRIVDGFASYYPSVILFGGEPLLYKDWYELSKYIKKKKLRCHLPTNGTLLEENAYRVVETMDNIDLSLDGTKEIHDEIRGVKGTFDKAISGIKLVNQIKAEQGRKKPYLNVCCTITEGNYRYLEDLAKYFCDNKIEINILNFQHVEFTNRETLAEHNKVFEALFGVKNPYWRGAVSPPKDIDLEYLIKVIERLESNQYKEIRYIEFEPNFTPQEIREYYDRRSLNPKPSFKKCLAPWFMAQVLPSGGVWLCPGYSIGNAKEVSLPSLWNNKKAREFRRVLNQRRSFPMCGNCYTVYLYKDLGSF